MPWEAKHKTWLPTATVLKTYRKFIEEEALPLFANSVDVKVVVRELNDVKVVINASETKRDDTSDKDIKDKDNKNENKNETRINDSPPRLLFLCGTDLLESLCNPDLWAEQDVNDILEIGVVCIQRGSAATKKLIDDSPRLRNWKHNIWIVPIPSGLCDGAETEMSDVSSTLLRKAIQKCADTSMDAKATVKCLQALTHPCVAEYIHKHGLYVTRAAV